MPRPEPEPEHSSTEESTTASSPPGLPHRTGGGGGGGSIGGGGGGVYVPVPTEGGGEMLVPEDEIEYAQAPPPPAPKLSGPEIASEEQQMDKYDDKGNQNFWLSPPWSGPGEAPPEVTATETYLTPDQKKNLADLLANDPSALQWCPLCVGQDVPPLPPPPFTCPQCPSGQVQCAPAATPARQSAVCRD